MAAKGVKLWVYAELDNLRLTVKRLFAGKPAAVPAATASAAAEEMPAPKG